MSLWPALERRGAPGSRPETLPGSVSAAEAAREAVLLVELAIRRTRGNPFVAEEDRDSICGPLEEAKEEILLIGEGRDHVGLEVVQGGREAAGHRQANGGSHEVGEERGWREVPTRKRGKRHADQPC